MLRSHPLRIKGPHGEGSENDVPVPFVTRKTTLVKAMVWDTVAPRITDPPVTRFDPPTNVAPTSAFAPIPAVEVAL